MSEELKPCAHCGGEAFIAADHLATGKFLREKVACNSCWVSTQDYYQPNKASEAWNIRTNTEDETIIKKLYVKNVQLGAKYQKLLAFVTRVAASNHIMFNDQNIYDARVLLKEMGEA